MTHIDSIKYRKETLDRADLTGWTVVGPDSDGHYTVEGPCPKCRGQCWGGPALPQIPDGHYLDTPEPVARVIVHCNCGAKHGDGDLTGCGRSWSALITIPDSPAGR